MVTSSRRCMPSCSGQNGMTCIRPTAPALETAQRSKRLSTSSTASTSPGGSGAAPLRCVSQYTVRSSATPLVVIGHVAAQLGFHQLCTRPPESY